MSGTARFRRPRVLRPGSVTQLDRVPALVGGLFRIIGSLMYQFPHWGWTLVGGIINLALGIMIWEQWPEASLWVIGLFIGIDLIFTGWTWVMLALSVKRRGLQPTAPN